MATRKVIESDLSGKTDAATVTFAIGDDWYEVDLTPDEESQLASALETYVKVGRKAVPKGESKPKQVPYTTPEERETIRAWAVENGYELNEYGRIPKQIMAAYDEAHNINRKK